MIAPDDSPAARSGSARAFSIPWGLVVGALTLATFAVVLRNGFVNWDDDVNILQNDRFRGLDGAHLGWMFTTTFGGHYQPLTWLSFALDHAIWGLAPFGYHLTNIILHAIGAVFVYHIARRLLRGGDKIAASERLVAACAALAAGLFAVHPLRVESVAWVTERRDVLSGVFCFACVLAYLAYTKGDGWRWCWYGVALAFFVASLLSKAAAVPLPLVLLVLDWYPLRRGEGRITTARLILEKLPFLAVACVVAVIAIRAQQHAGAWRAMGQWDIADRAAIIIQGVALYAQKAILPTQLAPLYLLPTPESLWGAGFMLSLVVVAALAAIVIWLGRREPAVWAAAVVALLLLAPVSGVAQSGKQLAADRYTYLPSVPIVLLVAAFIRERCRRAAGPPDRRREARVFVGLAVCYLAALVPLTVYQCTRWRDGLTLWRHAVAVEPDNSVAHVNLGEALRTCGDFESAADHFVRAAAIDPADARAFNGAGLCFVAQNDPVAALAALERAVALAEDQPHFRCNLGYVLAGFGRTEEAAAQYAAALVLAPRMTVATQQLAALQVALGRYGAARDLLEGAIAHAGPGRVLAADLAWLLATCPDATVRDGARAAVLAEPVCAATDYEDPWALQTLAAALAASARFDEAEQYARRARALAETRGAAGLAAKLGVEQALYAAGEPLILPDAATGPVED